MDRSKNDRMRLEKRRDEVIGKLGKQFKAMYELQKVMYEKIERLEDQIKKEQNKKVDLSSKIWAVNITYFFIYH